jgi:hypothetical protein
MAVRPPLLATVLALAALLVAAPAADAGTRLVPYGFFGVMWDQGVSQASDEVQDAQWDLMAESGVESVRTVFNWAVAQRRSDDAFNFEVTDGVVRRAAQHGIGVLPVVNYAPVWARAFPSRETSPPANPGDYAAYLSALITRYGPNGTFWSENPTVPVRPVREWQIWNEPHLDTYWNAPLKSPWGHPRGYGKLLRVAYRTVKSRDPGAKVVLAGITQKAWDEIAEMYRDGGIKGAFDVASLQIFPQTVQRAARAIDLFHSALRAFHDTRKPIYVTELAWPASKGKTVGIRYQRQETPRGMATKLGQAFSLLARERHRLGLARVYWYTWASEYGSGGSIFNYAGLQEFRAGTFTAQPALGAFQRVAREFQGCQKDFTGACQLTPPA